MKFSEFLKHDRNTMLRRFFLCLSIEGVFVAASGLALALYVLHSLQ